GVELGEAGPPSRPLASDERGARAGERIEANLAAPRGLSNAGLDELGRLRRRVLARGPGAVELEDRGLGVVAVPAAPAAAEPPLARLIAVQDLLMAVVVIGAPEDHRVLHPDEGLAKLPAGVHACGAEAEPERAAGGGDIQRGARGEGGVDRGERSL